jgi:hypothetical protein
VNITRWPPSRRAAAERRADDGAEIERGGVQAHDRALHARRGTRDRERVQNREERPCPRRRQRRTEAELGSGQKGQPGEPQAEDREAGKETVWTEHVERRRPRDG